jgi:hypothetical protein
VAQCVGLEFETQYHKKKKRESVKRMRRKFTEWGKIFARRCKGMQSENMLAVHLLYKIQRTCTKQKWIKDLTF